MACLGGRSEFIGMLGTDPFGDFLHASLHDAGVGTEHVQRTSAAPTALAFVTLDEHGERSFSFYRSPAADLLFRESKLALQRIRIRRDFPRVLKLADRDGIAQTTLACMRRARDAGTLVSFDMNLRPALWPSATDPAPRIRAALALADVVKLSVEELDFLAARTGSESKVMRRTLEQPRRLARRHRWRTGAALVHASNPVARCNRMSCKPSTARPQGMPLPAVCSIHLPGRGLAGCNFQTGLPIAKASTRRFALPLPVAHSP